MSSTDFTLFMIQGRLTGDPEIRNLENGNTLCKFKVASNRRFGGEEKTCFVPVTVFGKDAVNCGKYLSKGRMVVVRGIFETDSYTDRDGVNRTGFGIIADDVIFGPGGRQSDEEEAYSPPAEEKEARGAARRQVRGHRGR